MNESRHGQPAAAYLSKHLGTHARTLTSRARVLAASPLFIAVGSAAMGLLPSCSSEQATGDAADAGSTGSNQGGSGGGSMSQSPDAGEGGSPGGAASAPAGGVGGSGGEDTEAGTATLGESCDQPGVLACAGHYQKVSLICGADQKWVVNKTCDAGEFCHSDSGPDLGTCKEPVSECAKAAPGDVFCRNDDLWECGPDTTQAELSKQCYSGCENDACQPTPECRGEESGHRFCDARDRSRLLECGEDETADLLEQCDAYNCGEARCYPAAPDPCPDSAYAECTNEDTCNADLQCKSELAEQDRYVITLDGGHAESCSWKENEVVYYTFSIPDSGRWRVTVAPPWYISYETGSELSCEEYISGVFRGGNHCSIETGSTQFNIATFEGTATNRRNLVVERVGEQETCP